MSVVKGQDMIKKDEDVAMPDPRRVQRDSLLGSTELHFEGNHLERMLAMISAEVTAQAKRERICVQCGKMLQPNCLKGVIPDGSHCPNLPLDSTG